MPAIISPPEFYNQSELISNDIDRVSGVSEYQRGSLPEIRRTATEAGIIQDAANARLLTSWLLLSVPLLIALAFGCSCTAIHDWRTGCACCLGWCQPVLA
jgi:hypothetical protein